jgi:hypothetical protein
MKLSDTEREIATTIVQMMVDYGMIEKLAEGRLYDWFYENELCDEGFNLSTGMTKACITHDDLFDWVIKVGFTRGVKIDYAKKEYECYCLAEEAGLGYYFPTTVYLGEFGGRPFYLQQAAECSEDQVSSDWYERLRDRYEENGELYDVDGLWDIIYDMDDYEKAMLTFGNEELANFLHEHKIGDLHEGNFGYIGDHMVIVDFSGFIG